MEMQECCMCTGFMGSDNIHAESTACGRSRVYVRVEERLLLNETMMEALRPQLGVGRTKFDVNREEDVKLNC